MKKPNIKKESRILQYSIVIFWALFWFFNVIDKLITSPTLFWAGKNRLAQFGDYFASIGIEHAGVAFTTLIFTTVLELIAFVLAGASLWFMVHKHQKESHLFFFWATVTGLVIFSFFAIGDQVFGDRMELWEHTMYWVAILVSWIAYLYLPTAKR